MTGIASRVAAVVNSDIGCREIYADLCWGTDDPLAVGLVTHASEGVRVRWDLYRDMLAASLRCPGVALAPQRGDVAVRTVGERVRLRLRSPDGEALVWLARIDLARFIDDTEELCLFGAEDYGDLDAEWRALESAS